MSKIFLDDLEFMTKKYTRYEFVDPMEKRFIEAAVAHIIGFHQIVLSYPHPFQESRQPFTGIYGAEPFERELPYYVDEQWPLVKMWLGAGNHETYWLNCPEGRIYGVALTHWETGNSAMVKHTDEATARALALITAVHGQGAVEKLLTAVPSLVVVDGPEFFMHYAPSMRAPIEGMKTLCGQASTAIPFEHRNYWDGFVPRPSEVCAGCAQIVKELKLPYISD